MNQLPPLINNVEYSFVDITLNIMGSPVYGFTRINYTQPQVMENLYGASIFPLARAYGKIEPTCSITFYMGTLEAIRTIAPGGRLTAIPEFDIPVTFTNAQLITKTHIIRNCRFMSDSFEAGVDDVGIQIEVPLLISNVEFGQ